MSLSLSLYTQLSAEELHESEESLQARMRRAAASNPREFDICEKRDELRRSLVYFNDCGKALAPGAVTNLPGMLADQPTTLKMKACIRDMRVAIAHAEAHDRYLKTEYCNHDALWWVTTFSSAFNLALVFVVTVAVSAYFSSNWQVALPVTGLGIFYIHQACQEMKGNIEGTLRESAIYLQEGMGVVQEAQQKVAVLEERASLAASDGELPDTFYKTSVCFTPPMDWFAAANKINEIDSRLLRALGLLKGVKDDVNEQSEGSARANYSSNCVILNDQLREFVISFQELEIIPKELNMDLRSQSHLLAFGISLLITSAAVHIMIKVFLDQMGMCPVLANWFRGSTFLLGAFIFCYSKAFQTKEENKLFLEGRNSEIQKSVSNLMVGRDETICEIGVLKDLLESHQVWMGMVGFDEMDVDKNPLSVILPDEGTLDAAYNTYMNKLAAARKGVKNLGVDSMIIKAQDDHERIQVKIKALKKKITEALRKSAADSS